MVSGYIEREDWASRMERALHADGVVLSDLGACLAAYKRQGLPMFDKEQPKVAGWIPADHLKAVDNACKFRRQIHNVERALGVQSPRDVETESLASFLAHAGVAAASLAIMAAVFLVPGFAKAATRDIDTMTPGAWGVFIGMTTVIGGLVALSFLANRRRKGMR